MSNWIKTKLEDVADIESGYGFPHQYQGNVEGELPFAKVSDISRCVRDNRCILDIASNYINFDLLGKLKAKTIPKGSIVFAKIGEAVRLNRRAIASRELVIDNNVMALVPKKAILSRFLFHFMRTVDLYSLSGSTAIPSVRKSSIAAIEITVPPLAEQERIVSRIEALQSKCALGARALEVSASLLELLRQSILAAAFRGDLTREWREQNPDVEPAEKFLERIRIERRKLWEEVELAKIRAKGKTPRDDGWKAKYKEPEPVDTEGLPELPEGWCWAGFFELFDFQGGSQPPKSTFCFEPKEGYIRLLQIRDFVSDKYAVYIKDSYKWPKCEADDIMIGRYGASVGKVLSGKAGAYNVALVKLRYPKSSLPKSWVEAWLNSDSFQGRLEMLSRSAQDGFNKDDLSGLAIALPPEEEIIEMNRKIYSSLFSARTLDAAVTDSLQRLSVLESSILNKAFRGELVPQDPNDEPASVLIERIRQERAASPSKRPGRGRQKK
jgi:type I restriction enzyme S subunit